MTRAGIIREESDSSSDVVAYVPEFHSVAEDGFKRSMDLSST